jgi:NAD+ kinase
MGRRVGIVVHRNRPEALFFAQDVITWLQARQVAICLDAESAHRLSRPELECPDNRLSEVDFIITLGGDGTILTAARMAVPAPSSQPDAPLRASPPILGVHMGRFGFIAETHPDDLYPHLEEILQGQMRVEERGMIHACIWRSGACIYSGIGLNEALVKSTMAHLLRLKTYLGGALFATYPADGILVATPTGSTGYALSAGGPLVEPTIQALVIVPICPHTLSARPMVVPGSEIVEIEIEADGGEVILAVDGVDPTTLQNSDRVVVRRADYVTRLIVLDHATFYRKVRDRYLYGGRLNE